MKIDRYCVARDKQEANRRTRVNRMQAHGQPCASLSYINEDPRSSQTCIRRAPATALWLPFSPLLG